MADNFQGVENAYISGQPGTTGREPFENPSGTNTGISGQHGEHGQHGLSGQHGQHGQHGLTGGLTGGDHNNHQHGTGLGSGSGLGGAGDHNRFGQTGNLGIDEATAGSGHQGHHQGATGTGIAAAVADRAGSDNHGQHGHHSGEHDRRDYGNDRVGALGQDASKYERTGPGGPTTSGAAGTDRFDTDKAGLGSGVNIGSHHDSHLHNKDSHSSTFNPNDQLRGDHKQEHDVTERGEGKGTGGIGGILGTTDKEFTARDRLGKGAYHDDNATFQGNTSGPGGNTALTGREGTLENNPVYREKSRAGQDVNDVHGASGEQVGSTAHPAQKEKGLLEKIKDHLPI